MCETNKSKEGVIVLLRKLFKKQEMDMNVLSPLSGKAIPLEEVPDEVFSQKMMGDGIAIEPISKDVLAPFSGVVVNVFKTKHAINLRADNGAEMLIHMGLETVELDGKGFEVHVNDGQKIKQGDVLATYDIEAVAKENYKTVTPVILLNGEKFSLTQVKTGVEVSGGKDLIFQLEII